MRILWKPYSPNRGEIGFERRRFLSTSLGAVAGGVLAGRLPAWADDLRSFAPLADQTPQFQTDDAKLTTAYQLALSALTRNTLNVAGFSSPVLIEGSVYPAGRVLPADGPVDGRVYGVGSERLFADGSRPVGFSLAALWGAARRNATGMELQAPWELQRGRLLRSNEDRYGLAEANTERSHFDFGRQEHPQRQRDGSHRYGRAREAHADRGDRRTGFRGRSILAEWKEKENPRTAECCLVDLNAGSDQSSEASKRFQIQSNRDGEFSEGWVAGTAHISMTPASECGSARPLKKAQRRSFFRSLNPATTMGTNSAA